MLPVFSDEYTHETMARTTTQSSLNKLVHLCAQTQLRLEQGRRKSSQCLPTYQPTYKCLVYGYIYVVPCLPELRYVQHLQCTKHLRSYMTDCYMCMYIYAYVCTCVWTVCTQNCCQCKEQGLCKLCTFMYIHALVVPHTLV